MVPQLALIGKKSVKSSNCIYNPLAIHFANLYKSDVSKPQVPDCWSMSPQLGEMGIVQPGGSLMLQSALGFLVCHPVKASAVATVAQNPKAGYACRAQCGSFPCAVWI